MSLTAAFFDAKAAEGRANATAYAALPPSNDGSCVAARGAQFYDALPLGCWCCGDFYHPKEHFSVRLAESAVRYWDTPASGVGFEWRTDAGLRLPFWNQSRVFNLHMHNKQLHLFRSSDLEIPADLWAAAPERN